MPFPFKIFLTQQHTRKQKNIISFRKEEELRLSQNPLSCKAEKVSVSTLFKRKFFKAGVTVEAIICIPVFIYAAICLLWILEFQSVQTAIRSGMQETGRQMAVQMYEVPIALTKDIEKKIVDSVGAERLDKSFIEGGRSGLHCEDSYIHLQSQILEMKVKYRVKLPFPHLGIPGPVFSQHMRVKGWTGYVREGAGNIEEQEMVFITPEGVVYHRKRECPYLRPSIKKVTKEDLKKLRNKDGEIYHACEKCAGGNVDKAEVYITSYGEKFHFSSKCSGLKRKIYEVPLSSVKGRRECSKCGR